MAVKRVDTTVLDKFCQILVTLTTNMDYIQNLLLILIRKRHREVICRTLKWRSLAVYYSVLHCDYPSGLDHNLIQVDAKAHAGACKP